MFILDLPNEIRAMIWVQLFRSTEIRINRHAGVCSTCGGVIRDYAYRSNSNTHTCVAFPQEQHSYPLGIRETCHQIRDETSRCWLQHVQFYFDDADCLVDTFQSSIFKMQLGLIKHVHLHTCLLRTETFSGPYPWSAHLAMQSLPDLDLDTLTIERSSLGYIDYDNDALVNIIQNGTGWRRLVVVLHHSISLCPREPGNFVPYRSEAYEGSAEPSRWHRIIHERDGISTGAGVWVSRAYARSDLFCEKSRMCYKEGEVGLQYNNARQTPTTRSPLRHDREIEALMKLLITVTRGRNADIATPNAPTSTRILPAEWSAWGMLGYS